ncbi:MAG: hypothetical protein QOH61_115 [Chloroflexota bacterium]|jgi:hypothetical protein|nr:hypothetical protein [Chloroflexota bacterium]
MKGSLRFIVALLGALLAVSVIGGGAVLAGPQVHWVDGTDGTAGPGSCGGPGMAFVEIQSAVNAAGPRDTINVCPGTYKEQLLINGNRKGLTLRSVERWQATIVTPNALSGDANLVTIQAVNRIRIQGFRFLARTGEPCNLLAFAVVVIGGARNAVVTGNRFRPKGTDTWGGPCGLNGAVWVDGQYSSATIDHNLIKDWMQTAVRVDEGKALIEGNSFRSIHAAEDLGVDCPGTAIYSLGAATVSGNAVSSAPRACPAAGVLLSGGSGSVTDNVITGMSDGIQLSGVPADVSGNTVTSSTSYGIHVGNTTAGANIHDNDARNNDTIDCQDDSNGGATYGTANTWSNNRGSVDSPDGICSAP